MCGPPLFAVLIACGATSGELPPCRGFAGDRIGRGLLDMNLTTAMARFTARRLTKVYAENQWPRWGSERHVVLLARRPDFRSRV